MVEPVKIGDVTISDKEPCIAANLINIPCATEADQQNADIIEVRMDLMKPLTLESIIGRVGEIRNTTKRPLLGTLRKQEDGGGWFQFDGSEKERYQIFEKTLPFLQAIDVEYNTVGRDEFAALARAKDAKIIISYHNFSNTPDPESLERLLVSMSRTDSDILKIACYVHTENDYTVLLNALQRYVSSENNAKPLTVIPMGPEGYSGRFMFPWVGSCITYGCVSEAKAPSQPLVRELVEHRDLVKNLVTLPIRRTKDGMKALERIYESLASPA